MRRKIYAVGKVLGKDRWNAVYLRTRGLSMFPYRFVGPITQGGRFRGVAFRFTERQKWHFVAVLDSTWRKTGAAEVQP